MKAFLVARYLLGLATDIVADDIRKNILQPGAFDFLHGWVEYVGTVGLGTCAVSFLTGVFGREVPTDAQIAAARARLEAADLFDALNAPRRRVESRPELLETLRAAGVWTSDAVQRRAALYRRAGALAIAVPYALRLAAGPAWTWLEAAGLLISAAGIALCLGGPGPARTRLGDAILAERARKKLPARH